MGASIQPSHHSESIKIWDIDIIIIILLTYDPDMSHMIFSDDCGSPFLFIARAHRHRHTQAHKTDNNKNIMSCYASDNH